MIPALPDDLVARILRDSDQVARTSALLVDKDMARVASTHDSVWTEITFRKKLGDSERAFFSGRRIRHLTLEDVFSRHVQRLFHVAFMDVKRLFRTTSFDHLESLRIRFAPDEYLPVNLDVHIAQLPRLRHLDLTANGVRRRSVFRVTGFENLETFEFRDPSGRVEVFFPHWTFPRLETVRLECESTNFALGMGGVSSLRRATLRVHETFENSDMRDVTFLELNVSENVDDDALSGIRDVHHLVLRIVESAYLGCRFSASVQKITFALASPDVLLELAAESVEQIPCVEFSEDCDSVSPWNVLVHDASMAELGKLCSKIRSSDRVLLNFVNVTA